MAKNKSWLTGLLIKEDEQPVQKQQPQTQNASQFQARFNPAQAAPAVNPVVIPTMNADVDTPDQAYLDHLYKFMEEQNIPGPDYFEYANTLHEMSQMAGAIPESSLYQLAYVGLKAQGVTPDVLVQTASHYIELFGKHKQEFENVLTQEVQKSITSKISLV